MATKKKKPVRDESEMELLVQRGMRAVESQMDALEALIKSFDPHDTGQQGLHDKAVSSTNSLTKSIAALSAEQRQLEKHTRLRLDRLTPKDEDAIVMEYIQELPRPRRNQFAELIKGLDGNNDLLSL